MSNHLLKKLGDKFDSGYKPGSSLNEFHDSLRGRGAELLEATEKECSFEVSGVGNSASIVKSFVAPFDLEIVEAWVGRSGAAANAASVAVAIDPANDNKNPLASASVDLAQQVDKVPAQQTLNADTTKRTAKKGQLIQATFTTDASGTITSATLMLRYKPLAPAQV